MGAAMGAGFQAHGNAPGLWRQGVVGLGVVLLGAVGCASKDSGGAAPPATDWDAVQSQVLTPSCGFSSCHGGGAGGLTLDGSAEDHARLVGVTAVGVPSALVVPGVPSDSYLWVKVSGVGDRVGDVMPPGGTLDDDVLAQIRGWIEAGAPGP
jgi:hypothetical protein